MFSLWRKARRENSAASRLLGSTSLRFALHGWQRKPNLPKPRNLPLFPMGRIVDNAFMRLFVNQLTVLDFSYLDSIQGLVGESWQVDVELEGGLDEQGMVLDFGDVKRQVKQLIDDSFDHRLLLPADYSGLHTSGNELTFRLQNGARIRHRGPAESLQFIAGPEITPENVAQAIHQALLPSLPWNVHTVSLKLYPEVIEGPWYQYSHGLKHHCGNCQRIAHGHRSRIEIQRNGRRDEALEKHWAAAFHDIYIGTEEDMVAITSHDDQTCFRFSYTAEQGDFELELPAGRCYLMQTESTVENIARHIREMLEQEFPGNHFVVRAFEGIGKGAISETSSG
ncbi:6-carboxytetrahydropterin synthase [Thiolapillus sp.]|uniref:6-carboxytetrahydropterin synthase n=1 Tax=Thiolapillus sp. TaxID=2017437 RepID=UPI003AF98E1A